MSPDQALKAAIDASQHGRAKRLEDAMKEIELATEDGKIEIHIPLDSPIKARMLDADIQAKGFFSKINDDGVTISWVGTGKYSIPPFSA